jgi:hypothetical protein
MGNYNLLFESIFNRSLSGADTMDYLTQVTEEHPYFSPAQFFLLLQKEKGTKAYQEQVAKTATLFNNAHWLKFQLEENERIQSQLNIPSSLTNNQFVDVPLQENSSDNIINFNEPVTSNEITNNSFTEITSIANTNEEPIDHEVTTEPVYNNHIEFNSATEPNTIDDESSSFENTEQINITTAAAEEPATILLEKKLEISGSETEIVNENHDGFDSAVQPLMGAIENNQAEMTEVAMENVSAEQPGAIATQDPHELPGGEVTEAAHDDETVLQLPENENTQMDHPHNAHFNNDESPLVNETDEEEIILDEEVEPMKFRLTIDTNNVTEDTISFEPLHTSDYFASLGIKLSGEIQPTDKLGKQLKSFTEWLKTMKKIHSDQLPQQTGQGEITVQNLAEKSNKNEEVVTESMADVLLQQGKVKKAIEVFKKLSLLDTSKSAYFAAKIDQLKEL